MGLLKSYYLYILNRCPDCKCSSIAWGQWNDGIFTGKPVCFNPDCSKPSPYESHYTGRKKEILSKKIHSTCE
jgi:hypothetical protein